MTTRRRTVLAMAPVAVLVACLDKPPRPGSDSDGGDPIDAVSGDATGTTCRPWEIDDRLHRHHAVADLDKDGFDDVILPGEQQGTTGVFVIFGGDQVSFGCYHQFLPGLECSIVAVAGFPPSRDAGTGAIIALGGCGNSSGKSELLLYAHAEARVFGAPLAASLEVSIDHGPEHDSGLPVFLVPVDLDANGTGDVVFGDRASSWHFAPAAWTEDGIADTEVTGAFMVSGTLRALVEPAAPGTFYAVHDDRLQRYDNILGVLQGGPTYALAPANGHRTVATGRLDGQGAILHGRGPETRLFVQHPDVVSPFGLADVTVVGAPPLLDGGADAVALFSGCGDDDLMILDARDDLVEPAGSPSDLWIYRGVEVVPDPDGTGLLATSVSLDVQDLPASSPPRRRLVAGRFSSAGNSVVAFSSAPASAPPVAYLVSPDSGVACEP